MENNEAIGNNINLKSELEKINTDYYEMTDFIETIELIQKKYKETINFIIDNRDNFKSQNEKKYAYCILGVYYFILEALSFNKQKLFKKDQTNIKLSIKFLLQEIREEENNFFDEKDLIQDLKDSNSRGLGKRNTNIYNLIIGKNDDETYLNYTISYTLEKISTKNKLNLTKKLIELIYYLSFDEKTEEHYKLLNKIYIHYFYYFTRINFYPKTNIHTDLEKIQSQVKNTIYNKRMKTFLFNNPLSFMESYFFYEHILRPSEKSELMYSLYGKIFYNIDKLSFNDSSEEPTGLDSIHLFKKTIKVFGSELTNNPGIVAFLYLLIKEMSEDEILSIFPNKKTNLQTKHENYDLELVIEQLKKINPETRNENSDYYDYVKYLLTELKTKKSNINNNNNILKDEIQFTNNLKLVQNLIYFAVWEKVSYYITNLMVNSNKSQEEADIERVNLLISFFNPIMECKLKMPSISKQFKVYTHTAKAFSFEMTEEYIFKELNVKKIKSNTLLVNLLINLSKTELNSKAGLINQINLLRETQKKFYPIDFNKNKQLARKNQKKIHAIDKGFKIPDFIQHIYPFSIPELYTVNGINNGPLLIREVNCKLFYESDFHVYKQNSIQIDYKKTNALGLKTRYLFQDRNAATHYANQNNINNLLKPKNWKDLLYALEDFNNLIIQMKKSKKFLGWDNKFIDEFTKINKLEFMDSKVKNGIQEILYPYLFNELESLFNTLSAKLQQNNSSEKIIILISDTNKIDSKKMIDRIISFDNYDEEKFNNKLSYEPLELNTVDSFLKEAEFTFKVRLTKMLNIMFNVNGNNEYGNDHNTTREEFLVRYNSEISLYLTYMTFQLQAKNDFIVDK
jgi:hypothetical protein